MNLYKSAKEFDEDLTKILLKFEGCRNLPFLGEIRRYLHKKNSETLVTNVNWEKNTQ